MVLWLTLLFGIISQCDAVTYQLSAVPEKVAIGQTLTITAKLLDPTSANTDLRIHLTQPGKQTITLFQYRTATGCIFRLEPYISTGTVVSCEPANSRYVIRFQSVSYAHVGRYETSAPLELPSRSTYEGVSTDVQLLISPTSVTIAPTRREVIEDQVTNFDCSVDDQATTPVSFVWKRIVNGNRVNLPAGTTTSMLNGGRRSNRLTWNSVSRQHAGQYECRASNEVGQLTSQPAILVVYYPATSVTLTLPTSTTTVRVGTSVTFTCMSTGGNPRPGLVIADAASGRVLKESVQSWSSSLTYGPISMQKYTNGARYRCKTKTNVGAGAVPVRQSNALTLDVQFPPNDIKVSTQTVTVDEGQSTTVRCETTSSSNPLTDLTWTGPAVGKSVESTSQGSHGGVKTVQTVTLTGDRTRNGAIYTCTATHLGQQIYSKSTKLDVNFAPNAIAFYDTLDTPIPENQERVMRCRAQTSKPAGTIVWRKMNSGFQSVIPADPPTEVPSVFGGTALETTITIQPSRHDNGGKYWCEVDYIYTNGTKVIRRSNAKALEVYYPIEIGIIVNPSTVNIREGDPITFTCATTGGNPQTVDKYSWSHNDNILVDESKRTLSLNPVQYDQGGKYSCSATNEGGTSTSSVDIDIKYKPRLDLTVAHKYEIGAMVGESVKFSLTILANPAPTSVQWTATDGGDNLSPRFIQTTDGNVYSLQVNDITVEDFTTYICRVDNSVGSTHFLVTLKSRGPPETPSNFVALARSNDTITLHWISEFSGADSQTFLLEQIKPEWGVNEFELADPGIGNTVIYEVKNLEPATSYTFRLRSRNDLGLFSLYTKTTAMTKPLMYASSLDVRIVYIDLTTVAVTWKTDEELIHSYRNATVRIQYTPVRFIRSRRAFNQRTEDTERMGNGRVTAMFLHGSAIFNTSRGVQEYSFDVIVIDNDGKVVLSLSNLTADGKNAADTIQSFGMPLIITLSVLGLVVLISVSIVVVVAICCRIRKLKSRLKTALKSPEPSTKSPTATFDNAAFEEENPYMIPENADPAYYHYSGNKYAVAGKPDVNDVTDNDYDVIRAPGEGDYATIGDDRDKYDAMDDEAGYVDMSGINNNQDEKSVPENEYIEIDDRRNKKRAPENEYMEMKINDQQSKKSVSEDEYMEMHSPVGCKMPK